MNNYLATVEPQSLVIAAFTSGLAHACSPCALCESGVLINGAVGCCISQNYVNWTIITVFLNACINFFTNGILIF